MYSSFRLPTALAERMYSTPSVLKPKMLARKFSSDGMQPVPDAVPRQEGHALAAQRADHVRRRRIAERRLDAPIFAIRQLRHVVQTAAADDANRDGHRLLGWFRVQLSSYTFCLSSTSTPCALAGWMNATSEPCAPGRGCSSIRRTPWALSCARAAAMSSTRSVMWCSPVRASRGIWRSANPRRRLEQLQRGLAGRDEVRAHPLRRDLFRRLDLQAERIAIEREGLRPDPPTAMPT